MLCSHSVKHYICILHTKWKDLVNWLVTWLTKPFKIRWVSSRGLQFFFLLFFSYIARCVALFFVYLLVFPRNECIVQFISFLWFRGTSHSLTHSAFSWFEFLFIHEFDAVCSTYDQSYQCLYVEFRFDFFLLFWCSFSTFPHHSIHICPLCWYCCTQFKLHHIKFSYKRKRLNS